MNISGGALAELETPTLESEREVAAALLESLSIRVKRLEEIQNALITHYRKTLRINV